MLEGATLRSELSGAKWRRPGREINAKITGLGDEGCLQVYCIAADESERHEAIVFQLALAAADIDDTIKGLPEEWLSALFCDQATAELVYSIIDARPWHGLRCDCELRASASLLFCIEVRDRIMKPP
jgi:hypothetical protein